MLALLKASDTSGPAAGMRHVPSYAICVGALKADAQSSSKSTVLHGRLSLGHGIAELSETELSHCTAWQVDYAMPQRA